MFAWLLISAGLVSGSACAAVSPSILDKCEKNEPCKLEGLLAIESLWQASLDFGDECVALAVPRDFFDRRTEFDGKRAVVIGDVASQPPNIKGRFSYSYEIDGIRVNNNLCNKVIIVRKIEVTDGPSWIAGSMGSESLIPVATGSP